MIEAKVSADGGFTAGLIQRARALAEAYGETLLRAHRDDPTRWRRAKLLWPLFTKDP